MSTLIHADIFFFVTTIAIVIIAALFIIAILYVVSILKDLRYIFRVVRKETDLLAEDLEGIRDRVKRDGMLASLFALFSGFFTNRAKRSATNTKKSKHASE
jgi:hypothetical protein